MHMPRTLQPAHYKLAAIAFMTVVMPTQHVLAQNCLDAGLMPGSGLVVQLREAAQADRIVVAYRNPEQSIWFIPFAVHPPGRMACLYENISYLQITASDSALTHDPQTDLLTFLDLRSATHSIDARKTPASESAVVLTSLGINYQWFAGYSAGKITPAASAQINAYTQGWYAHTSLAWNKHGRIARYESYALRQSVSSGSFLRLGDAITGPTALGESLQFAGLSWGTDRQLRPGDFTPVLPTLRSGSALSGPLEVFINDSLQYQQTLQTGVYDLRNVPAQQGFNSYSIRTLDAQGNPITINREIYLPASLLPPGIQSWRLDAGLQREDFFTSNTRYRAPLISGSYAAGLSHDTTVGAQALVSRSTAIASAAYDRRLSALWTGHIGLMAARKAARQGNALEVRLDGSSRWWRFLAARTQAFTPLPGLGDRPPLVLQRLLRADWNGIPGLSLGLTLAQSRRDLSDTEEVATLSASSRVLDTGTIISAAATLTRASPTLQQKNLTLSLIVPLAPTNEQRNSSLYASHSSLDGAQLSRLQYANNGNSGARPENDNWGLGATYDSRRSLSAVDANWSRRTDHFELDASARAGQQSQVAQGSMRGGLVWTGGSFFSTRPITSAFAMVSTGEPDVPVLFENRPAGRTNERGLLLVTGLVASSTNRIRLNPANWPIHWTSSEVDKEVVPPLGGGVLVSFRINTQAWRMQTFIQPLQPNGTAYPAGTLVYASVDGDQRETAIDRKGQLWISELIPAKMFSITYQGKRCEFALAPDTDASDVAALAPSICKERP
jgi:outer membrane usher protein